MNTSMSNDELMAEMAARCNDDLKKALPLAEDLLALFDGILQSSPVAQQVLNSRTVLGAFKLAADEHLKKSDA